ncbi:MAG TPA: GAF domain-containing protein [Rhizobacter sp.]
MIPAPLPDDEAQRLEALRALLILDTPPEERFDRIVQFAADEFDVPMAMISLVDRDRQWFKARVGLEACETAREVSFCSHAVYQRELLLVPDALRDERFHDNPLVLGEPHVRFYAGAPLTLASGAVVGTLCVIDTRARGFDAVDRSILESLRLLVVAELERAA